MNHPNESELLLHFYGENDDRQREEIVEHLSECKECAGRISDWTNVSDHLNKWDTPVNEYRANQSKRTFLSKEPMYRANWLVQQRKFGTMLAGLAAMIIVGFVVGRLTGTSLERDDVESMINERINDDAKAEAIQDAFESHFQQRESSIRELIKKQQDLVAQTNDGRISTEQVEELQQILEQITAEQYQLRSDLQTLAINAESKINENRLDLNQLIRQTSLKP